MSNQFLASVLFTALAFQVNAQTPDTPPIVQCPETPVTVNEVPLPREAQLGKVVWRNQVGVWTVEDYLFQIHKYFRNGSKRFLSVSLVDAKSGKVLKTGGVAIDDDGSRASGILTDAKPDGYDQNVTTKKPEDTFIILRYFKETDSNRRGTSRDLFVITIRTLLEKMQVCEETHHELLPLKNRK